jgi:glycyl-tRNA synthetase beta subunit
MIKDTKDVITLEKIYIFLDNKEELFKLLFKKENEYRLMANIDLLKDNYNNELLKYFKERFYEVLAEEKSRDNYRKAVVYIEALYKLNDGKRIVDELIKELKNSEYSKRIALFDEISKVIKYIN